jgi:hypothetical protein
VERKFLTRSAAAGVMEMAMGAKAKKGVSR